jgi:asparagine N-glycosylation enzyme membrane subunit Stt3
MHSWTMLCAEHWGGGVAGSDVVGAGMLLKAVGKVITKASNHTAGAVSAIASTSCPGLCCI